MGGAKSKPVTETARQVLAKRNVPPASSSGVKEVANGVDIIPLKIDVRYNPESLVPSNGSKDKNDYELDQNLIAEISKWSTVKQTTKNTQVPLAWS